MIYIEGYALVSSLGKEVGNAVEHLRTLSYVVPENIDGYRYYKIPDIKQTDYYTLIENVIADALEHAGIPSKALNKAGLFIGTSSAKLPLNEMHIVKSQEILHDLNMHEVADIIADKIDLQGYRTMISTACTSSANALVQAKEMLESGLIDKAIVVGVELYNLLSIKGFDSFMLLSDTEMKPFDKNRNGIILGEGLSAVILGKEKKRFQLSGGAIHIDNTSITSPQPQNLVSVMQEALENAHITADTIACIKTHSTATIQNDDAEGKAIDKLFGTQKPTIVALKPYIGHTMGACGTNELVLLMESLMQGFIPKTIHFDTPDDHLRIIPQLHESAAKPAHYLLNYFGFGGNNSTLILYDRGEK